jgi:hypothetical protein
MVSRGDVKRGVLLCGTGLGMAYAANRHPHVRAAVAAKILMADGRLSMGGKPRRIGVNAAVLNNDQVVGSAEIQSPIAPWPSHIDV